MKKYTKKTVYDYLLGNNIDDYDIDELENDPEFMADVVCRDINSYNLCSKEIRNNFIFVKKVLKHHNIDPAYALIIYNNYRESFDETDYDKEEEEKAFEIDILMRNITKNEDEAINSQFILSTNFIFEWNQFIFDSVKNEYNENVQNKIGLGFDYQRNVYDYNETITKFLAEKYIEKIFFNNINLENILHKKFEKYNDFENSGIRIFLIQCISQYDVDLADYVINNEKSLDILDKELQRIKNNWSSYNYHLEQTEKESSDNDKYIRIIDRVTDYCEENNCYFDHWEAIGYVGEQFGIKEELKKYVEKNLSYDMVSENIISNDISDYEFDKYLQEKYKEKNNEYKIDFFEDFSGLSDIVSDIETVKHIKNIKRIFAEELGFKLDSQKIKKITKKSKNKVVQFRKKYENIDE